MIAPTKGIAPQRALLAVGAQILLSTDRQTTTVTQAWRRLRDWREANRHIAPIPFWWFVLALDVLYALGVVELRDEVLVFQGRTDAA